MHYPSSANPATTIRSSCSMAYGHHPFQISQSGRFTIRHPPSTATSNMPKAILRPVSNCLVTSCLKSRNGTSTMSESCRRLQTWFLRQQAPMLRSSRVVLESRQTPDPIPPDFQVQHVNFTLVVNVTNFPSQADTSLNRQSDSTVIR